MYISISKEDYYYAPNSLYFGLKQQQQQPHNNKNESQVLSGLAHVFLASQGWHPDQNPCMLESIAHAWVSPMCVAMMPFPDSRGGDSKIRQYLKNGIFPTKL